MGRTAPSDPPPKASADTQVVSAALHEGRARSPTPGGPQGRFARDAHPRRLPERRKAPSGHTTSTQGLELLFAPWIRRAQERLSRSSAKPAAGMGAPKRRGGRRSAPPNRWAHPGLRRAGERSRRCNRQSPGPRRSRPAGPIRARSRWPGPIGRAAQQAPARRAWSRAALAHRPRRGVAVELGQLAQSGTRARGRTGATREIGQDAGVLAGESIEDGRLKRGRASSLISARAMSA